METFEKFDDMGLPEKLLRGIYNHGFDKPSPIQQKAIVPLVNGRNMIGQAKSGSGKTGAFSIGLLARIDPTIFECQALVLVPTRELAIQIHKIIGQIGEYLKIVVHLSVGKTDYREDIRQIRRGVHVVVGTPGRTYDMLSRNDVLDGKKIKILIVDEADELISQDSFGQEVYDIMQKLRKDVQIGLFSATFPNEMLKMVEFIEDPVKILIEIEELKLNGINQFYIDVERNEYKLQTILDLYKDFSFRSVILFCNSQKMVDELKYDMTERDFSISAIHSAYDAKTRKEIMEDFYNGKSRVLITTDLLARGIDVVSISLVINVDLPNQLDLYQHRVFRSSRQGKVGCAINLVTKRDMQTLHDIEKYYNIEIEPLPQDFAKYF